MTLPPAIPPGSASSSAWATALESASAEMKQLLRRSIAHRSVSGNEAEFVRYIAAWATAQGFGVDLWCGDEHELDPLALGHAGLPPHIPLTGRPTLVIRLPGNDSRQSLIFGAHSDVVCAPSPERWRFDPWSGEESEGLIFGRGACDAKGPLVSALWAMDAIRQAKRPADRGTVLLELVPGEEDCVGLGTLTSVARGYRADAAVILEPTESQPRCASRGGMRFEINCKGKAVHGTVRWLGRDAIEMTTSVLSILSELEQRWNQVDVDPLFTHCPVARPITVDKIIGGDWQGMVCDRCTCAGYFELLPNDSITEWKQKLVSSLHDEAARRGISGDDVDIGFTEEYRGHRTDPSNPLCCIAEQAIAATKGYEWSAFNSGCEAGLRWALHGTPTLVWGPGSLAQAHAVDEYVLFDEVHRAAGRFARLIDDWCRESSNLIGDAR